MDSLYLYLFACFVFMLREPLCRPRQHPGLYSLPQEQQRP